MNPLTILPLLAVAMAAPGVLLQSGVVSPGAVTYTSGSLLAQTVQVPLTKTIHYENRPVVTGYQTSVIKPAIAAAPVISVPQSVVLQQQPIAQVAQSNDAIVVEARSAVPVAPAVQVATVRAAQAGDFGPLVTKEKVLAPVRAHTQITPQVTQIQPEVTVRRVVQEVPVATPVAVQTPVVQQLSLQAPTLYAGQQLIGGQQIISGQQLIGGQQILSGQQLIGGQQILNGQHIISGARVIV
ncbi:unnamed protein product [Orchesella dallaii]|uniref:Cuticle protein n=1 Tax=Orchesella dallaii TaxID=48710 RepID=A0ABP1RRA7_9HEXA